MQPYTHNFRGKANANETHIHLKLSLGKDIYVNMRQSREVIGAHKVILFSTLCRLYTLAGMHKWWT